MDSYDMKDLEVLRFFLPCPMFCAILWTTWRIKQ